MLRELTPATSVLFTYPPAHVNVPLEMVASNAYVLPATGAGVVTLYVSEVALHATTGPVTVFEDGTGLTVIFAVNVAEQMFEGPFETIAWTVVVVAPDG